MKYVLPVVLLLASFTLAGTLPDAPQPQADHTVVPQSLPHHSLLRTVVSPVKKDPAFALSTGMLFASTIADEEMAKAAERNASFHAGCKSVEQESLQLRNGKKVVHMPDPDSCHAVSAFSPAVVTGDSRAKYYIFNLAGDLAVTYLDYRMKHSNNKLAQKLWYVPAAVLTDVHIGYMFSNVGGL